MMKNKLAIIGASIDQKPLALKAKEMGIETWCFAWDKYEQDFLCKDFADHYIPISVLDKEKILEECRKIQIDGVASIANDYCVPTVSFIAQNMGFPGNRYEDSLIAINKLSQRQAFAKYGVNCPTFTHADDDVDLTGFTYPLIVKPVDRSGSVGVLSAENEDALRDAVAQARQLSFSNSVIIEEYMTGCEATVDLISWQGKHYAIAISDTETTRAPYYTKIGYHQPSGLSPDIQEKIMDEAKKAITALKINYGASDVEAMVTDKGEVKIIEVNARMGSDCTEILLKYSAGYDIIKAVINMALNRFEEPVFPIKKYSGVCFLGKETEYLLPFFENKEKYPEIVLAEIVDNKLYELRCGADRSGYFIYQSEQRKKWNIS